jgi:hypothetical protein
MSIPLKDQVAKMVGEGEELNPPEVSRILQQYNPSFFKNSMEQAELTILNDIV